MAYVNVELTHQKSRAFTSGGFVTPPNIVEKIVTSGFHSCAISARGDLKCWGNNASGQLGYNDTTTRGNTAGSMANLSNVNLGTDMVALDVALGNDHTCVLLVNDQVKCWGSNSSGQLGYEDGLDRGHVALSMDSLPTLNFGLGRTVKGITAGYAHTCVILDNAAVKCWGENGAGQLGYDDTTDRFVTTSAVPSLNNVELGAGRYAVQVAAGGTQTCAILEDGAAKCWGANWSGQLGQNDNFDRGATGGSMAGLPDIDLGAGRTAVKIAVGIAHVCAILDDAKLKCWGANASGQLGYEDTTIRGRTVGSMAALGNVDVGAGLTVQSVALGSTHTCVRLNGGSVKCWGLNDEGQLGYGDRTDRGGTIGSMTSLAAIQFGHGLQIQQLSLGGKQSCAVDSENKVKCWGQNNLGQLGLDDITARGRSKSVAEISSIFLGSGRTVKQASAGMYHACAILDNNELKCWGWNGAGNLGYDSFVNRGNAAGQMQVLPDINLGAGRYAKQISAGGSHTCAVLDDNTVKCWGANNFGQCGYEIYTSHFGHTGGSMAALPTVILGVGRTAKTVTAGRDFTCAILDDDSTKCWGRNNSGQLGIDDAVDRGLNNGDMAGLPPLNFGVGRHAVAIDLGAVHGCALLDNNGLKCWGSNSWGQLGYDDTTPRGMWGGQMAALTEVNLGIGRTAKKIAVDGEFTCVIMDNDQLKCFGNNVVGQLGTNDTAARGGYFGSMASLASIDVGIGRSVKSVGMGYAHVCAVLDNDHVKCWGYNVNGQLGLNDTVDRGGFTGSMMILPEVNLGTQRTAKALAVGRNFSCAQLDNDEFKCWGANENGQSGQNNTIGYATSSSVAETPRLQHLP